MTDNIMISTADARRLLGDVSPMWIHRRLRADPTFPRPHRYAPTGPRRWHRRELLAWLAAQRADDAGADPIATALRRAVRDVATVRREWRDRVDADLSDALDDATSALVRAAELAEARQA